MQTSQTGSRKRDAHDEGNRDILGLAKDGNKSLKDYGAKCKPCHVRNGFSGLHVLNYVLCTKSGK